jgi:hypothetical protein
MRLMAGSAGLAALALLWVGRGICRSLTRDLDRLG